jgi:hypothetical protein
MRSTFSTSARGLGSSWRTGRRDLPFHISYVTKISSGAQLKSWPEYSSTWTSTGGLMQSKGWFGGVSKARGSTVIARAGASRTRLVDGVRSPRIRSAESVTRPWARSWRSWAMRTRRVPSPRKPVGALERASAAPELAPLKEPVCVLERTLQPLVRIDSPESPSTRGGKITRRRLEAGWRRLQPEEEAAVLIVGVVVLDNVVEKVVLLADDRKSGFDHRLQEMTLLEPERRAISDG